MGIREPAHIKYFQINNNVHPKVGTETAEEHSEPLMLMFIMSWKMKISKDERTASLSFIFYKGKSVWGGAQNYNPSNLAGFQSQIMEQN